MNVHIAGTGSYLPERVMTNAELADRIETSDEWIVSHTGIHSRHIMADGENCSTMAVEAARRALAKASIRPEELGYIVMATSTPDYVAFPATACIVQNELGAAQAMPFDISAGCTGFVTALDIARGLLANDTRPVLVVCSEAMSRILDWNDRNTCPLFGDGAGAVVLTPSDRPGGILKTVFKADGSGHTAITHEGGSRLVDGQPQPLSKLKMNGRAVFNFAVKVLEEMIERTLKINELTLDHIAHIIPHQANTRIIDAAARRLGIPIQRFFVNIAETANTSSASIPIALDQLAGQGLLHQGDRLLLAAFGAGLVAGGTIVEWNPA